MEKLTIKAGQPIIFIGTLPNEPMILKAGASKAVPETKITIMKGEKLIKTRRN